MLTYFILISRISQRDWCLIFDAQHYLNGNIHKINQGNNRKHLFDILTF